ncbi:putative peroxisomal primary amine oxidase [Clavispora lusitaniae]|uniref:Peroxisomal primary amine oxidase n=1 Tax=Clavispora lusitaniae TaxID=36911 RepID=A0ACD0WS85_CLALS|nr:putative peroxisomal primary amine oxidase [Clavispora lusitaniae]QFZ36081.1 putative peroxisomal primary amine oxidase [Clavispora lusitaniae]QFZ41765.1 putative peroxisomal primary amine oxidase [Clavispora lusitaniae]QFZ47441.1 putative peroxisomal primary amine oxidase [Clavispora lusitaniae]QFZ53120.1 putative peroxisomal primary amine oxidase [Clavispora lusitaniae]
MERLQQIASQATASTAPPAAPAHPLDPLSRQEIKAVSSVVTEFYGNQKVVFNTITLREPIKRAYYDWKERNGPVPPRLAYYVVVQDGINGVAEGVVDIPSLTVVESRKTDGVQPILTPADLSVTENIIRTDPEVIRQCEISGLSKDEMANVYCDAWTIGYDERWGASRRLQQALMYWRSDEDDSQYSHPLDFCPIVDMNEGKVVYIDIPNRRRKVSKHKHSSFHPKHIAEKFGTAENPSGFRQDDTPYNVTQPEGVSFKMDGHIMEWSNFRFHIGFNYREGIVLSDMTYNDHGNVRPLFHRISLSEMIVPYGSPDFPHQRKHALDIGEYGAGNCTNPLSLGCDCKGVIHYMDAHFTDKAGDPLTVKNAVCIHEEDDGLLFKHSDFRDDFQTTVVTRGKKLIVSQIFTAANYEYCVYWQFRQDGTIKLEIRLTGILNTYICDEDEDVGPWGTVVYPKVNAHNHQHMFSLRLDPRIDGDNNSAAVADGKPGPGPTGSSQNMYGNSFLSERTVFKTVADSLTDATTTRSWDIFNPSKINPYSGKPSSYKLVSTFTPPLMAKEGSLVRKRAPWAAWTTQVVPYKDEGLGYGRLYPSGDHVAQWSGDGARGMRKWIGDGTDAIENTDILFFHTFGITHFPAPEDFPVMPTEIFDLMLRPRHFFTENPVLDVKPSYTRTTSEVKAGKVGTDTCSLNVDKTSRLAFAKTSSCCKK